MGDNIAYQATSTLGNSVYSLTNAPMGESINPRTGVMTWTPTSTQVGSHTLSIQANAGASSESLTYDVTVTSRPDSDGSSVYLWHLKHIPPTLWTGLQETFFPLESFKTNCVSIILPMRHSR